MSILFPQGQGETVGNINADIPQLCILRRGSSCSPDDCFLVDAQCLNRLSEGQKLNTDEDQCNNLLKLQEAVKQRYGQLSFGNALCKVRTLMSSVFTSEKRFPVLGSRAACWSVSTSIEDHLCFPCSWDQKFPTQAFPCLSFPAMSASCSLRCSKSLFHVVSWTCILSLFYFLILRRGPLLPEFGWSGHIFCCHQNNSYDY